MATSKYLQLARQLEGIIPSGAIEQVVDWLVHYRVHLRISKPRKSKYGDYQSPFRGETHKISVNGDLNPFAFLSVFVHEMAHLVTHEEHGDRVKPHGKEWENNYLQMMLPFIRNKVFPSELELAMKKNLLNPGASGCVDTELHKALRRYDPVSKGELVENLRLNELFSMSDGKVYRRGKKLRKRYRCVEIHTNETYLFSPIAEVFPVEE